MKLNIHKKHSKSSTLALENYSITQSSTKVVQLPPKSLVLWIAKSIGCRLTLAHTRLVGKSKISRELILISLWDERYRSFLIISSNIFSWSSPLGIYLLYIVLTMKQLNHHYVISLLSKTKLPHA